ncbi:hypothetical protein [Sphingobacterium yanglingense]|nr:hypothetical protein [Sphingobacterium yanglingense]
MIARRYRHLTNTYVLITQQTNACPSSIEPYNNIANIIDVFWHEKQNNHTVKLQVGLNELLLDAKQVFCLYPIDEIRNRSNKTIQLELSEKEALKLISYHLEKEELWEAFKMACHSPKVRKIAFINFSAYLKVYLLPAL